MKPCPHCQRKRPDFTIEGGKCDFCRSEAQRELDASNFDIVQADTSWTGPQGDGVRQERNRLLESFAWTTRAGSPLTPACQAAFASYFEDLHGITVDFPNPSAVTWPMQPQLQFKVRSKDNGRK
jgi:hypothetical protein